jgi:hypothetical protein
MGIARRQADDVLERLGFRHEPEPTIEGLDAL